MRAYVRACVRASDLAGNTTESMLSQRWSFARLAASEQQFGPRTFQFWLVDCGLRPVACGVWPMAYGEAWGLCLMAVWMWPYGHVAAWPCGCVALQRCGIWPMACSPWPVAYG